MQKTTIAADALSLFTRNFNLKKRLNMPMFRVVRPVLLMECVLVQAKDDAEAAKLVAGDGKNILFFPLRRLNFLREKKNHEHRH